jgi:lipopolysaccharide transport system ATP-binding protein
MRELASEGRTVLFVSHSMSAVKELCETAILMDHGRVKEKTRVDDAIGDYMRHAMHVHGSNMPLETEQVDLLALRMAQGGRASASHFFDGDAPVDVELVYRLHLPLTNFRMGFYVKNVFGEVVTRALLADRAPATENAEPGTYRLKGTIQAGLLVAGDYVLEVHCSEFGVRDFFGTEALQPFRVSQPALYNVQHSREPAFGHIYLDPGWDLERLPD